MSMGELPNVPAATFIFPVGGIRCTATFTSWVVKELSRSLGRHQFHPSCFFSAEQLTIGTRPPGGSRCILKEHVDVNPEQCRKMRARSQRKKRLLMHFEKYKYRGARAPLVDDSAHDAMDK
ncbi:hypothetical protein PCH_Pc13g12460 [Penicillium rubens Wisconsin 54-1255]|uniref:Uncharacterized protein n=1 Tax=Penicillium rubens (strain ATCC 28089 / DSM 1075 / NRRL 1951 / Wisconsin 54-1255) TaxID=500485 RepID=B6H5B7_PENRW|nr:hypothetical protein PCH_Pc13g12460 [Penicillium rubens Wisconsin 54-1255]